MEINIVKMRWLVSITRRVCIESSKCEFDRTKSLNHILVTVLTHHAKRTEFIGVTEEAKSFRFHSLLTCFGCLRKKHVGLDRIEQTEDKIMHEFVTQSTN